MDGCGVYENVILEVHEITGEPGDIAILDPRCLHSYSANTADRPREVIRIDFKRLR